MEVDAEIQQNQANLSVSKIICSQEKHYFGIKLIREMFQAIGGLIACLK